ncbi:FIST C-terminal domain-containing protein [Brucepastera parasyntrophica]|uniref:FIST signal transduction protein n=1 Tax=Brucepastera parasyntrophica TaxID=2880008 RepID=UPI00210AB508|nr:FIST N-terminal domain-containing protein [Brucepastera parasyntrophica]ULQ59439.1 FIST C-terminal domain-containing protein [Brucepastera parasyntrophica]
MAIKVAARSTADFEGLIRDIDQPDIQVVIYFFSVEFKGYEPQKIIKKAFPSARCIGASMIGGWCTTGAISKGITAMSLSSEEIEEVFVGFREGVKADPGLAARGVIDDLRKSLGGRKLNPEEYLGIILFDGLCLGEEIIREFTIEKNFIVPVIGGSAADELEFKETLVSFDEKMSGDGVIVMILKMKIPFYFNHYVHYLPTKESFIVTKSEPAKRIVWEIDGEPAAPYYARALGLSGVADIKHTHFSRNPLGVVIGDTVYTRSPNAVVDGTGLQFYCFIEAGTRVQLLRQGDIIENARSSLRDAREYIPNLQGALLFNCVLRYLELKELGKIDAFNEAFKPLSFAGFNTYGEELFTHHNQTLTAVFFGR